MLSIIIKEWFKSWVLWAWMLFIGLLASEAETVPKLQFVDDQQQKKKKNLKNKTKICETELDLDDEGPEEAKKCERGSDNKYADEQEEDSVQVICIDADDEYEDDEYEDEEHEDDEKPTLNVERLIDSEDASSDGDEGDEECVKASITFGRIPPQQTVNKYGVGESVKVNFEMKKVNKHKGEEDLQEVNVEKGSEGHGKSGEHEENNEDEDDDDEMPWLGAGRGTGLTRYHGVQNLVTHNDSTVEPVITERRSPLVIPRREGPLVLSRSSLIRSLSQEKDRLEGIPEEEKEPSPSLLDDSDKLWASLVARYSAPQLAENQGNENAEFKNKHETVERVREAITDLNKESLPAVENMTSKEFSAQVGERLQTYLAKIEDLIGDEDQEEEEDYVSTDETREIDVDIAAAIDVNDTSENNKIFIMIEDDDSNEGKESDSEIKISKGEEKYKIEIEDQPRTVILNEEENLEKPLRHFSDLKVKEYLEAKDKRTPIIIIDEAIDYEIEEESHEIALEESVGVIDEVNEDLKYEITLGKGSLEFSPSTMILENEKILLVKKEIAQEMSGKKNVSPDVQVQKPVKVELPHGENTQQELPPAEVKELAKTEVITVEGTAVMADGLIEVSSQFASAKEESVAISMQPKVAQNLSELRLEKIKEEKTEKIKEEKGVEIKKETTEKIKEEKAVEINKEKTEKIKEEKGVEIKKETTEKIKEEKGVEINKEKTDKIKEEKGVEINKEKTEKIKEEKGVEIKKGKIEEIKEEKNEISKEEKFVKIKEEKTEEIKEEKPEEIEEESFAITLTEMKDIPLQATSTADIEIKKVESAEVKNELFETSMGEPYSFKPTIEDGTKGVLEEVNGKFEGFGELDKEESEGKQLKVNAAKNVLNLVANKISNTIMEEIAEIQVKKERDGKGELNKPHQEIFVESNECQKRRESEEDFYKMKDENKEVFKTSGEKLETTNEIRFDVTTGGIIEIKGGTHYSTARTSVESLNITPSEKGFYMEEAIGQEMGSRESFQDAKEILYGVIDNKSDTLMRESTIDTRNEEKGNPTEISMKRHIEGEDDVPAVTIKLRKAPKSSKPAPSVTDDVPEVTIVLPKKKKTIQSSSAIQKGLSQNDKIEEDAVTTKISADLISKDTLKSVGVREEKDDEIGVVRAINKNEKHKSRDLWKMDYEKLLEEQQMGDLETFYHDRKADVLTTTYDEFPEDCILSEEEMRKSPIRRRQIMTAYSRKEEEEEEEEEKYKIQKSETIAGKRGNTKEPKKLKSDVSKPETDDDSAGYLLAKERGTFESPEGDETEFTFVLPISKILNVSDFSNKEPFKEKSDKDKNDKSATGASGSKIYGDTRKVITDKFDSRYLRIGSPILEIESENEIADTGARSDTIFYNVSTKPNEKDSSMLDMATTFPGPQTLLEDEELTHVLIEPVMKDFMDERLHDKLEAMKYCRGNYQEESDEEMQTEVEVATQPDQRLDVEESSLLTEDDQKLIDEILSRKSQYERQELEKRENDATKMEVKNNSEDNGSDIWEKKLVDKNESVSKDSTLKGKEIDMERSVMDIMNAEASYDEANTFRLGFREPDDVTMGKEDDYLESMEEAYKPKKEEKEKSPDRIITPEVMSDKELILNLIRSERSFGNDDESHIEDEIPDYLDEVKDLLVPRARRKKAKRRYRELDDILKVSELSEDLSEDGASDMKASASGTVSSLLARRADSPSDIEAKFLLTEEEEQELAAIKIEQDTFKAAQRRELEKYLAMPSALTKQEQIELDELLAEEASNKVSIATSEARLEALLSEVRKRVGGSQLDLAEEEFERYIKLPAGLTEEEELLLSNSEEEKDRSEFKTDEEYREYIKQRYLHQLEEDQKRIEEEEYEYEEYDEDEYDEYEDDYEYEDEGLEGEYVVMEEDNACLPLRKGKNIGIDEPAGAEAEVSPKKMKKNLSLNSLISKSSKSSRGSLDKLGSKDSLSEDPKDSANNPAKKFFRFGSLSIKRKKKSNDSSQLDPQIGSTKEHLGEVETQHDSSNLSNKIKVILSKLESAEKSKSHVSCFNKLTIEGNESALNENEIVGDTFKKQTPENVIKKQIMLLLLKKMQTNNESKQVEKGISAKLSPVLTNKFINPPSPFKGALLKRYNVKVNTNVPVKVKNDPPNNVNTAPNKANTAPNKVNTDSPNQVDTDSCDRCVVQEIENDNEANKPDCSTIDINFENSSNSLTNEGTSNLCKNVSEESFEKGFWNDWDVIERNKESQNVHDKMSIVEDNFVMVGLTSYSAEGDKLINMKNVDKEDNQNLDVGKDTEKEKDAPNLEMVGDKGGVLHHLNTISEKDLIRKDIDPTENRTESTDQKSEQRGKEGDRVAMGIIPIPNNNYINTINAELGMTMRGDSNRDVAINEDATMPKAKGSTSSTSTHNAKKAPETQEEELWPEEEMWPEEDNSKVVLDEFEQMEKEVLLEMEKEKAMNGEKKKEGEKKLKKKKKRKGDAEKENKKTAYQSKDVLNEKHVGPRIRSFDAAKMKSKFNKPKEPTQVSTDCRICGKQVFQMEKIVAEKASWHKNCFRCNDCNKQLTLETYQSNEGNLYCKPHFKELFRPKAVVQDEAEERKERLLRRPRMIILESKPEILPDDVVRATLKPDYGLEELQTMNVKDRFAVFENLSKETEEPKIESIAVRRSQSLLSKVARMMDGQNDNEESEEDNDDEEVGDSDESGEENPDYVKSKKKKERPMSFSGMRDLKAAWEQKQRREEMTQSRKEEISKFRLMLCAGKNSSLKEKFESGNFDDHEDEDKPREEIKIEGKRSAGNLMKKFEKGRPFIMDDEDSEDDSEGSDSDEPRKRNSFVGEIHEVEEIFKEAETAKKARNVFKQIDSKMSQEGAPVMRSHSFAQNPRENRLSLDISSLMPQCTPCGDVVKADDKAEEFKLDTTDLVNRFKFFSTYEEREKVDKEKKRKVFRITPPREGVDQGLTTSDDADALGRDPNLIKCTDNYQDEIDCRNTKNILQMFKKMEMGDDDEDEDEGPRPLKRFTPPLNEGEYEDSEEYSEGEYTDEEEESEEEDEDENGVLKPKMKDEILQMGTPSQSARKAASLRAKFERWETEVERHNDLNSKDKEDLEEECRPSLDTARNLKAMFEHKANEVSKPVSSKPVHQKVNRFVGGGGDRCVACDKTVYAMEKMEIHGKVLHKNCFKCFKCNTKLSIGSFSFGGDHTYCQTHYKQLFTEKGSYDAFSPEKGKWTRKIEAMNGEAIKSHD